jgi:hypothetical protein
MVRTVSGGGQYPALIDTSRALAVLAVLGMLSMLSKGSVFRLCV